MSPKHPRKPRLSLTKTQIEGGVGAELLALCQSATEDGRLSKDEIIALISWLKKNQSSDLPAVKFLQSTVEQIIAKGKVTKEDRKVLYGAIESILPPEARKYATEQRRAVEAEEIGRTRAERDAQRLQEREERKRDKPIKSVNFMVAGVHHEGRPEVIKRYTEDGDRVFLARDRNNRYSQNAIEVRLQNGMQIGFVPEDDAPDIAPLLDQGCRHKAYINKILVGGHVPIPVVQTYVYRADANVEDAFSESQIPPKRLYASQRASGCLTVLAAGILLSVLGLALTTVW